MNVIGDQIQDLAHSRQLYYYWAPSLDTNITLLIMYTNIIEKEKNQELYFDFLKYIFSVHCCFTTFQCYHFVYAICVSVCYNILFYWNTQLIILVFILTLNLRPTLFYLTFIPCSTLFQDDWVDFLQGHLVHFCDPFLQLYLADPKETNG